MRRRVERGLLFVAKRRLDDLFADLCLDAEAALDEAEVAPGGQGRAREHHARDALVQAFSQERANVDWARTDGRAAAAPLGPAHLTGSVERAERVT